MSHSIITAASRPWKPWEKGLFRFAFIYFIIQTLPLDWKYIKRLFSINWFNPSFIDFFNISRYTPQFVKQDLSADFWGLNTWVDWLIAASIAAVLSIFWYFWESRKNLSIDYKKLHYLLLVLLRYRLALAVIAYGLIKFFPLQAPYPSLSSFNTDYGDLYAWKIFSLSLGIAPKFESTLGALELLGGLLLFYRGTVPLATFIIIVFHGNVFLSNLAYEGAEALYSLYILQIAGFLFLHDAARIIAVFSLNKPAQLIPYKLAYTQTWQPKLRLFLKVAFIFVFVFLFGFKTYSAYKNGISQYPGTAGLTEAEGLYNVSVFKRSGEVYPYSLTDTVRWQDVVFEKWSTLSIRSNKKIKPYLGGVEAFYKEDKDRRYELAGSNSRQFYYYTIDSIGHQLHLENKNPHYSTDKFTLHYQRPDKNTLLFSGLDAQGDSLEVRLERIDKKYLYEESIKKGRRGSFVL